MKSYFVSIACYSVYCYNNCFMFHVSTICLSIVSQPVSMLMVPVHVSMFMVPVRRYYARIYLFYINIERRL